MSQVRRTQTRDPRMSIAEKGLDDARRYVRIQVSEPGVYKSPLPKYLDAESPTHPGERMFRIHSDGRKSGDENADERTRAGGDDMVMLEYVHEEDREHVLRYGHPAFSADGNPTGWQDAMDRERRVKPERETEMGGHKAKEFEQVTGGVLTA